jgi:hypothetical protein
LALAGVYLGANRIRELYGGRGLFTQRRLIVLETAAAVAGFLNGTASTAAP